MAKPERRQAKYQSSTRRPVSERRSRLLVGVLIGLAALCVLIVLLALLVATGEITLR
ncbi:MAG: hypothetical protein NVS4B8_13810 [Herpetosiphon sp.]